MMKKKRTARPKPKKKETIENVESNQIRKILQN